MNTLHITNGDSTVYLLEEAKITGEYLPWRDVLHMGPVPANLTLQELSKVRASFLATLEWGTEEDLLADFIVRDQKLETAVQYEKVIFWFEHDLYDQLQLIQLFDWLSNKPDVARKSYLINPNKHLGYHTPEEARALLLTQKPVAKEQLELARKAWHQFTQPDLRGWKALLTEDTSALPYLHGAIERSLGELPQPDSGCTQTEMMALRLINRGVSQGSSLFQHYNQKEENAFHGDAGFFWYLHQMSTDTPPLVTVTDSGYELTALAEKVIAGQAHWKRQHKMEKWLGGYCMTSTK